MLCSLELLKDSRNKWRSLQDYYQSRIGLLQRVKIIIIVDCGKTCTPQEIFSNDIYFT